jgi:hypothetical protein
MFGFAQLEGAAFFGARVDQLLGLEDVTAVITLVGASAFEAADITGPFHVAVRQEAPGGWGVPLHGFIGVQVAVLLQCQEDGLGNLEVIFGVGRCEQIVGDPVALEQLKEPIVIFLVDFLDRLALLVRRNGDGRAVRVGAADHQDVVPFEAVVAGDDVTRQV